jgi:HAD superfamily hydrolase (TIGR01509 family)
MIGSRPMTAPLQAVLFDFAGTLLAPEDEAAWVRAVLRQRGVLLAHDESAALARRLVRAGRPGPVPPAAVPAEHAELFAGRDLSAELHRAAYTALLGSVALPEPVTPADLYERSFDPEAWVPYPDARPTLRELREAGIRVAVVSNTGFDLRPIFAGHGLDELVAAYVLSHELGIMKPDPAIFRRACELVQVEPARALMVGDSPGSDAGGVAAGIRTLLLPAAPAGTEQGLDVVLSIVLAARAAG